MTFFVDDKQGSVSAIWNESDSPKYVLALAHGAGAGMTHRFMEDLAIAIARRDGHVLRFNFPYLEQGRKAPGSPKTAQHTIVAARNFIQQAYPDLPTFLSGKSYGGRMSSHVIADRLTEHIAGVAYFGFPLHAPGRDGKDRAAHLTSISIPQLFLQGTKDKLANFELINEVVKEQQSAQIVVINEADHGFKVPKRTGLDHQAVIELLAEETNQWALDQI